MKKLLAIIFALVIIFSMSTTVFAETADRGSETEVNVTVNTDQISATVPLVLEVEAKVDGGEAEVPNNYGIQNDSLIPVKVATIQVILNDTGNWAFKGTAIEAKTEPTVSGKNDIFMSINGEVLSVHDPTEPTEASDWHVTAGGVLLLPIVCSTSKLNQTTSKVNLFTVRYVISPQ